MHCSLKMKGGGLSLVRVEIEGEVIPPCDVVMMGGARGLINIK